MSEEGSDTSSRRGQSFNKRDGGFGQGHAAGGGLLGVQEWGEPEPQQPDDRGRVT